MQRILAVAVGLGRDRAAEVSRDVIKAGRVQELRPYIAGLIDGLQKLGLKPGEDFEIDYATSEPPALRKTVKDSVGAMKPDAMFAMSTTALKAAMAVSKEIPIVFPSISDPVEDGVVKSTACPGKNATGVQAMRRQTADECLELFKATVPSLRTIVALHKPNYGPATRAMARLKQAAKRARVRFASLPVRSQREIEKKLGAITQKGPAGKPEVGTLILPDDLALSAWRIISELARERRLPTFFPVTDWVRAGSPSALAGFGVPQITCGQATAPYMHKVLKGIPPRDLPVKRIGGFEWAVNKAVAAAIGITIPENVLKAADRVVG
jgi:putative ABC transport system substrate-binding protein